MDAGSNNISLKSAPRRCNGFTLQELLTTLTIASLIGTTVPSLQNMLAKNRIATQVNRLVGDMNLSRSEAIKRKKLVRLCKSSDGVSCSDSSEWQEGWITYEDNNQNKSLDDDERVLRVQGALKGKTTIRYNGGSYITFSSTGFARSNGTFTFCDQRGTPDSRTVILSRTGRVRLSRLQPNGSDPVCPG